MHPWVYIGVGVLILIAATLRGAGRFCFPADSRPLPFPFYLLAGGLIGFGVGQLVERWLAGG